MLNPTCGQMSRSKRIIMSMYSTAKEFSSSFHSKLQNILNYFKQNNPRRLHKEAPEEGEKVLK